MTQIDGGPVPEQDQHQEEMILFMMRELEKLQLLVARLRQAGVISNQDFAIVELQAEVRENDRLAEVAEAQGLTREAARYRESITDLNRKISALVKQAERNRQNP